jgi:pyruvate/2-oxoglutarate dehydrogenase complex dihydrolipoamide dehydrogenase (E3) component
MESARTANANDDPADVASFDHVFVGSGQAVSTMVAALPADETVAIIEGAQVGGTCVNTGCTPTKTMIASAKVAFQARRAGAYGVRTGPVDVDFAAVMARMEAMRRESREGLTERFESAEHVTLIRGWARFTAPRTVRVGERTLRGERVYLNVGARARVPDVPGLADVPWLDNARLLELRALPEHLLVLGGSYVGLEFGQMLRRFGAEVSILEARAQLMGREDADVAEAAREILAEEGLHIELEAQVARVEATDAGGVAVVLAEAGGERRVVGSHLLVAAGRVPNSDRLDLDLAGIEVDERGHVRVDDQLRTSAEGVFALGDVNGEGAFTHTSVNDGEIVLDCLRGGPRRLSSRNRIYAMYLDPPLGRLGLTEREALERGVEVLRVTRPMAQITRAREMGETKGLVKVLVDAGTERFVGVTVFGVGGDEIIGLFAVAMNAGMTWREFRTTVLPHPTVAEMMPWTLDGLEPAPAADER